MRISRSFIGFAGAMLLVASGAFAPNATKGTLRLYETVSVQGKQLPPGNYKVEWNGTGANSR